MDLFNMILGEGIKLGASDIHLAPGSYPVYRVDRRLIFDESIISMSGEMLENLVVDFSKITKNLEKVYEEKKQVDFSYTYCGYRFRINLSLTKGYPTFSIRLIPNGDIDIETTGIKDLINRLKKVNSGLILITGKVNSGKSTTLNAFIQELNKEANKKIVTIEDPIEYVHVSNKCVIIQKEVGIEADVLSYYDGLINLLREDADISVLGEIRDKKTMDVALDLAESGGLVIGTLHTRSCGETIERIINMYEPTDQTSIKNTVSSILKLVISQKLLVGKNGGLVLVPEVMVVNSTISAQIRQVKFSVSEIEDSVHSLRLSGCKSFESSLTQLYVSNTIDMKTLKAAVDQDKLDIIKGLIVNAGGILEE
ncbi:MAG: ATPase, T2SS/T4P/T4SS family [Clostridia bacterium]|nr:ATPase, T2SS/T4P/T4SS family [Clostridia bacterium]MDD4386270.1 ATPase, T2SS/T4P/T4SS family [Clostridia bacterium]